MSSPELEPEQQQEREQEEMDRGAGRIQLVPAPLRDSEGADTDSNYFESPMITDRSPPRDELEEAYNAFRDKGLGHGSRSERKTRKAVLKLGMRPVPNIHRVTIKKSKNILFVIAEPEVYHSSTTDTYVIFGKGEFEDLRTRTQQSAAEQFTNQLELEAPEIEDDPVVEEEEGDLDEEGLDVKDIELVMNQADASRARAVHALKKCDKDIVSAIMELTLN